MNSYNKISIDQCRLDLWLWAARFYKTRNIAATKIRKGLILLIGKETTKPSSLIKKGSQIIIERETVTTTVLVESIAVKRVSFDKSKKLYVILDETVKENEVFFKVRKKFRPDKKERRHLNSLKTKLNFLSEN